MGNSMMIKKRDGDDSKKGEGHTNEDKAEGEKVNMAQAIKHDLCNF